MLEELLNSVWEKAQLSDKIQPIELDDGRQFTNRPMVPVNPPEAPTLHLHTLRGLAGYLESNRDQIDLSNSYVQVVDYATVMMFFKIDGPHKTRRTIAHVVPVKVDAFRFGQYMDQETFVIEAQSKIVDSVERVRLLKLVGNIASGQARSSSDDGVSQAVNVKVGATLLGKTDITNPFTLAPFRTFPEVEQPKSPFILRVSKDDEPKIALFEADGGKWRIDAMQSIAQLLGEIVKVPVLC